MAGGFGLLSFNMLRMAANKVWDEIIFQSQNFNRGTVEV